MCFSNQNLNWYSYRELGFKRNKSSQAMAGSKNGRGVFLSKYIGMLTIGLEPLRFGIFALRALV